jgi:hypothetical protein
MRSNGPGQGLCRSWSTTEHLHVYVALANCNICASQAGLVFSKLQIFAEGPRENPIRQ